MKCWGCGGTGHSWKECSTPRQGNNLPLRLANQNLNGWLGEETQASNPLSNDQGGANIDGQLRQARVSTGTEYYIDIDGKISKALINSSAMISMMSKVYYDENGYKIQPLDWLVPIAGSTGADVPYLGYVEVQMWIPGISSFDQDVLMLISHTTTCYHKREPLQVSSQIIDQVTNCITEEELKSLSQSSNWCL